MQPPHCLMSLEHHAVFFVGFESREARVFLRYQRRRRTDGVGSSIVVFMPAGSFAAAIHDGQGDERITDPRNPIQPRLSLFGVHDTKYFDVVSCGSEAKARKVAGCAES